MMISIHIVLVFSATRIFLSRTYHIICVSRCFEAWQMSKKSHRTVWLFFSSSHPHFISSAGTGQPYGIAKLFSASPDRRHGNLWPHSTPKFFPRTTLCIKILKPNSSAAFWATTPLLVNQHSYLFFQWKLPFSNSLDQLKSFIHLKKPRYVENTPPTQIPWDLVDQFAQQKKMIPPYLQ